MELFEQLETLKKQLEEQAKKKNEISCIRDIQYYKDITFDLLKGKEEPLYLIEKEVDGQIKRELQMGDTVIADINEDNTLQMRAGFSYETLDILIKLRDKTPISLKELEQREMDKQKGRERLRNDNTKQSIDKLKETQHGKQSSNQEEEQKRGSAKDIEIDINKKVTVDKTFADLVPEVKEKQIQTVKIRRLDATRFEFYGENKDGQEVAIQSLKAVEGTNPTKEITEVEETGEVGEDDVYALFQIINGTNEQNGNEGVSIDIKTGIPEVAYYRRTRDNEYTSVPINLKNTNQKRTDKEVQEYAEKTRNPEVSDNIEKAQKILKQQQQTTLDNVDDDEYNDNRDTTIEYEEALIKEAAKRCKMSEEGFKKVLEQERKEGEPIEASVERAENEINDQVIGRG